MGKIDVDQILVTPLKRVSMPSGDVLHGIRDDDVGYISFGEAYFSIIKYDAIKAWKRHLRMTLNLVVPVGRVKFVFIDNDGAVREEIIGDDRYARLTVPPGIWFGFQGLVEPDSLLMNIANIIHDPAEIERKDLSELMYLWGNK